MHMLVPCNVIAAATAAILARQCHQPVSPSGPTSAARQLVLPTCSFSHLRWPILPANTTSQFRSLVPPWCSQAGTLNSFPLPVPRNVIPAAGHTNPCFQPVPRAGRTVRSHQLLPLSQLVHLTRQSHMPVAPAGPTRYVLYIHVVYFSYASLCISPAWPTSQFHQGGPNSQSLLLVPPPGSATTSWSHHQLVPQARPSTSWSTS